MNVQTFLEPRASLCELAGVLHLPSESGGFRFLQYFGDGPESTRKSENPSTDFSEKFI